MSLHVHDIYRFYYDHPDEGQIQCYPSNGTIEWSWTKESSQIFYRKDIATDLRFVKEDFNKLYDLDRSGARCEKIAFTVERKCGDSWIEWYAGYIALVDGEFDVNRCILTIRPRLGDKYACILNNWEVERDIISGVMAPQPVDPIRVIDGTLVFTECSMVVPPDGDMSNPYNYGIISDCLPPGPWLYRGNEFGIGLGGTQFETDIVLSLFVREVYEGTNPPGAGWESIGVNLWARIPSGDWSLESEFNPDTNFPHGRRFEDVLEYLIDCGLTIVSNFFSINADLTAPDNQEYQYAMDNLSELIMFQKSDVKNRFASNPATRGIIKLKELLEDLHTMFDVYWDVEDNIFRLEHYTYWQSKAYMLDLTIPEILQYIAGRWKYTYSEDELPKKELWSYSEETNDTFDAPAVEYNDDCTKADQEESYQVKIFTNHVTYIVNNPENIGNAGYVLLATREGVVISESYDITKSVPPILNGSLTMYNLIQIFHRHRRPLLTAKFNFSEIKFESTKPIREQNDLSFPICCSDLETFEPKDLVRTQLGWGEVKDAQLKDPGSKLTLNLLHY